MSELPNRIRELRLALKMSQQELADLVGCSKMQISGLERGRPVLDVEWMRKLAPHLRVSPGELLNAKENPYQLTAEELRILTTFREASPEEREQMQRVAEAVLPFRNRSVA